MKHLHRTSIISITTIATKFFFIIACLTFVGPTLLHSKGFLGTTPVATPDGYTAIQDLKIGDLIISHALGSPPISCPVRALLSYTSDRMVYITLPDGTCITATPGQLFYAPSHASWIRAEDLTPQHTLLANASTEIAIINVVCEDREITVYDLAVMPHHTFCVSSHNITVHNSPYFSIIRAGVAVASNPAAAWRTACQVAKASAVAIIALKNLWSSYKNRNNVQHNNKNHGSGKPPE